MNQFPINELSRYYHLIDILEKLVNVIDKEYPNDSRWFLFSLRVCRKLLYHCKNFCLHSADILVDEDTEKTEENTFVDVSGLFANLRVQMDCYSTIHHIFFDDIDWETKRLRFDLWRYDSYGERIYLGMGSDHDIEQLSELKSNIEGNPYYKSLDVSVQKLIFDDSKQFANWKFIPSRLSKKENRVSWTDLFKKTGINIETMNTAYGFLSMYVHSNFFSVAHLTEMDKKESYQSRNFAIIFSSFILCFTIDDLISKFIPGKEFLKRMKIEDFEIIKSFIDEGRIKEKNKNFV
ncbi:MAG: hypothetical protein ACT6QS_09810 [Flavobacteriales bacterium]